MSSFSANLGYNGELHEAHAPWQFLGNGYRVYNAVLMRFHSPDNVSPFGAGGINPYAYCEGEPINRADPSGHFFLPVAGLLLGLGSLGAFGAAAATGVAGNKDGATVLLAVAGTLALGALAAAGAHAFRPLRPAVRVSHLLGKRGAIVWRGVESDVVRVHGNKFVTNWGGRPVDGAELAQAIATAGGGGRSPKPLVLQSCHGGFGGRASQAQVVADTLGVDVTAYIGKVQGTTGMRALTRESQALVFKPQTGAAKEASRIRNQQMSRLRRPRRGPLRWPHP